MLTVLEVINKSTEYLSSRGIESARTNSELLLAAILQCKRLDLYLMYDKPLSEAELNKYRAYLKRRGEFEPLQYITGSVEFYGLEFKISPSVLIPRPETEILVETLIASVNSKDEINILDIGTGCGNIGIAVAINLPNVNITAIDISKEAIAIAETNTAKYELQNRINYLCIDILIADPEQFSNFDIIVSNPPYVSKSEYMRLQEEIKYYEPETAITDISNGLTFYKVITPLAKRILNKNGKLFFELGHGQSEQVKRILEENGFIEISIMKDYGKIDRVISGVAN